MPFNHFIPSDKIRKAAHSVENFASRFADKVKAQRQSLGLTQEELVVILQDCGIQVSQGYISLLEAGQRHDPNIKLVLALAAVLDVSLDDLIDQGKGASEND